jgi:HPr kinase/phosphorylase
LNQLTLGDLFDQVRENLGLIWASSETQRSTLIKLENAEPSDLVGFLNLIHPSRLQVLGHAETAYFARLDARKQQAILNDLFTGHPPAIVVAEGLEGPAILLEQAERNLLPIWRTKASAAMVIDTLLQAFGNSRGGTVSMHGVLMDVLGMGVLISGESGLGKSELALELISRGHGLVADDVVELTRVGPAAIDGRCPGLLQNLLEVRGLGLLDIKTIFGETAVRRKMRLKLIVHLVRRSTMESEYERLPLEALNQNVLGLAIRKVVVPVAAGRNLAVLTEAAVRSTILQLRGIDTVAEFITRQQRQIDESQ